MYLVFTVPHCPRCIEIKTKLENLNIDYKEIAVMDNKDNAELAKRYNVKTGGTVIDDKTGSVIKI